MARISTKNQLADAFIDALRDGTPPGKVRIRTLTDACALDRQTFYYHFKDIHELGAYAYDRALAHVFDAGRADEGAPDDWKRRVSGILASVEDQPDLRRIIAPMLGEEPMRKALLKAVTAEVERIYLPRLEQTGLKATAARERAGFVAYLLEAVLTGWITGEITEEVPVVLDRIDEMLRDYTAGVELRLRAARAGSDTQGE